MSVSLFKASLYIIFLIFILLSAVSVFPQANNSLSEILQQTLDSTRSANNLPGVSAAIIMPDNTIWTGVSGFSDPANNEAITKDMLFGIGSLTKTFTTAIIMKMAAQGILSPDDQLNKWLPSFNYVDSSITIKQLLSHTSGINNYTNNIEFWEAVSGDFSKIFTPMDILGFIRAPSFRKGTAYEYSSLPSPFISVHASAARDVTVSSTSI